MKALVTKNMVNKSLSAATFSLEGLQLPANPLPAGLYIVATPIGNLADITVRALQTLAAADLIACEDTRASAVLLQRYGITTPLTPYHDHNGAVARPMVLERLSAGTSVALISDAGTPLIADPGYKLVVAARQAGHPVFSVPGPSALTAALSIAGQPTDQFTFCGFLPAKAKARADAIEALGRLTGTLCFYEAPSRLADSLAALAAGLGGTRQASVCRELTKRFETVQPGSLEELANFYAKEEKPRGEIVIVLAPAIDRQADQSTLDAALRAALQRERVKDAASLVAKAYGVPRRDLYQRALELAQEANETDG